MGVLKKVGAGLVPVLGIVGVLAAIFAIEKEPWRSILLWACAGILLVASWVAAFLFGRSRVKAPEVVEVGNVDEFLHSAYRICHGAGEALIATGAATIDNAEANLLFLLLASTTQEANTHRRASVMLLEGAGVNRALNVRSHYPAPLFRNERMTFPESDFATDGGLCWLVDDALKRFTWGEELPLVYVPDTADVKHSKHYRRGAHHFATILFAPVLKWGTNELLGVVCLDSEKAHHYSSLDKRLISIVAISLAAVWANRGPPP